MSILTGPTTTIYADTTIPGTAAVAMTAFQAHGNSVDLIVTTTTGGAGSLTFTCERMTMIDGVATAYADVIDSDSVWSMVVTTPDAAGVYAFPLVGLATVPTDYYRLSYTAATAAGKVKVDMVNWENPAGGGADISVGDVIADMGTIDVNIAAILAAMGTTSGVAVAPVTGSAAIATTTAITTAFELTSITLHLSAAGTTAEDFTIGLDALDGAAYDTNLLTLDLSTDSIVDLVLTPQNYPGLPRYYEAGDELAFVWPNTEVRTYGLRIVTKGV